MAWVIWGGILPACLVAAWLVVRRPVRQVVEEIRFDAAREQFRKHREWLEARFLGALGKLDPIEAARWEEGCWQDDVVWARDRPSRKLLALIGVDFEPASVFDSDEPGRHATAVFEYRKGVWLAEGKRIDEVRPAEAFLLHQRLEQVVPHPPHRSRS